jgi:hypothetical protein
MIDEVTKARLAIGLPSNSSRTRLVGDFIIKGLFCQERSRPIRYSPEAFSVSGFRLSFVFSGFSVLQMM